MERAHWTKTRDFSNVGLFYLPTKTNTNLTTNQCEKCPSSIWCRDSNSRPSEHESPPPITTRPELPPTIDSLAPHCGKSLKTPIPSKEFYFCFCLTSLSHPLVASIGVTNTHGLPSQPVVSVL